MPLSVLKFLHLQKYIFIISKVDKKDFQRVVGIFQPENCRIKNTSDCARAWFWVELFEIVWKNLSGNQFLSTLKEMTGRKVCSHLLLLLKFSISGYDISSVPASVRSDFFLGLPNCDS